MILGGMKSVDTISVDRNYTGTNPVNMTLTKNLPTGILPTGIVPTDFMPPGIVSRAFVIDFPPCCLYDCQIVDYQ